MSESFLPGGAKAPFVGFVRTAKTKNQLLDRSRKRESGIGENANKHTSTSRKKDSTAFLAGQKLPI
jgi:hypothetical protein